MIDAKALDHHCCSACSLGGTTGGVQIVPVALQKNRSCFEAKGQCDQQSPCQNPRRSYPDTTMNHLLDNITWHALSGPQAVHATGTDDARRYAPGFSAIAGFANAERPNFEALAPYCDIGEHFYCIDWSGPACAGWHIEAEASILNLVWEQGLPATEDAPDAFEAVPLGPEHLPRVLELAALTRPGPFGPRTIELGEYFGCFEGERLMAMAWERMHAGRLREISGVCTHPDFQGRGLARRLMMKLIRRQMLRGETPFLHVMRDNSGARRLYERMGFRVYRESIVRVVSR
jgi:GNAT superfamily N-acetyltransferase